MIINVSSIGGDSATGAGSDGSNIGCGTALTYTGPAGAQVTELSASIANGANAGSITLQWSKAAAGGGDTTVFAGSSLYGFKVTGADVAEAYYTKDTIMQPGDVVMVDGSIKAGVQKTNKAYDTRTLGIISTKPGVVLGDDTKAEGRPVLLALNGRVPVKIASNSAAIKAGDFLTTSDVPGRAMKATGSGITIAKALEDWDPNSGIQTVLAFVNLSSYNPDDEVRDVNDLTLAADPDTQSGRYKVTDANGTTIAKVGRFSDAAIGNLKAGSVDAQKLTINGIDIFDLFKSKSEEKNNPALPKDMDMQFADLNGKLDDLQAQIASQTAQTAKEIASLKDSIAKQNVSVASQSADLQSVLGTIEAKDAILSATLKVLGRTTVNDLGVTGSFTAGVLSINGLDEEGNATINTLGGDLKLQNTGVGGVDILAGKIKIDTKGNMTLKESLTAKVVNTTKLNIVSDTTATPSGTSNVLSASAGSVIIKEGQTNIEVNTTALTAKSLIFATPDQPVAVGTKPKDKDTFIIKLQEPLDNDLKVNWWIVN